MPGSVERQLKADGRHALTVLVSQVPAECHLDLLQLALQERDGSIFGGLNQW